MFWASESNTENSDFFDAVFEPSQRNGNEAATSYTDGCQHPTRYGAPSQIRSVPRDISQFLNNPLQDPLLYG